MKRILAAISRHADSQPDAPALISAERSISYSALYQQVQQLAQWLAAQGVQRVGLYGENSPAWIIADLAAAQAGITVVPLPVFFSPQQLAHIERSAGLQWRLVCRNPAAVSVSVTENLSDEVTNNYLATPLPELFAVPVSRDEPVNAEPTVAADICKITFTSGTTGTPKGVCLGSAAIERVTEALADVMYNDHANADGLQQHLSLLPFSTLLENIAGIYVPLYLGKAVIVLNSESLGFTGSSQLSVPALLYTLNHYRPNSLIVLPQILRGMVMALEQGLSLPDSLQFVAVGGAHTSVELLHKARSLGIPVYEGYGLSECASVVSLNHPHADCPGSVGKPLAHVEVMIKEGGIFVRGNRFNGYLGQPPIAADEWLDTGDLGFIDEQGFIHITGRRKNLLISSFGRNISPEWIEAELLQNSLIAQAMVIGDAQPFCAAIIVPSQVEITASDIADQLESLNRRLPDYARLKKFIVADAAFTAQNGLLTDNGRLRRDAILNVYQADIAALYAESDTSDKVRQKLVLN